MVVAQTPGGGIGIDWRRLPFNVQTAIAEELKESHALDLSDYANNHLGSVSLNSAQGNPLQPDLQYRGFTASPLLGLPQGISVYQNGARINDPLGDAVNYDLLPLSAVNTLSLYSGANPLFGLNTLGGALSLQMKDGFSYSADTFDASAGSWDRRQGTLQSGSNNGRWGYYLNLDYFDEDGWRDLSDSSATNVYTSIGWRRQADSGLNLFYQYGDSDLNGNGSAPIGLVEVRRAAVFTAPDNTRNRLRMLGLDGFHFVNETLQVSFNSFYRDIRTRSLNGDASDLAQCAFQNGNFALLDEGEDMADELRGKLGIDLAALCAPSSPETGSLEQLQSLIDNTALDAGLDPVAFQLEDLSGELSGSGVVSDEAINNISRRRQRSGGMDLQLIALQPLWGEL